MIEEISVKNKSLIYTANLLNLTFFSRDEHDYLKNLILNIPDQQSKSTNVKANMTQWHMHLQDKVFKKLSDVVINNCLSQMPVTQTKDPKPFIYQNDAVWGASYGKGEYTQSHNHWPFAWSWCYYLSMPEGASPLVFPDCNYCFFPKEGDLILFDGSVQHEVPECDCEEKRVMVAGNICVVPNIVQFNDSIKVVQMDDGMVISKKEN